MYPSKLVTRHYILILQFKMYALYTIQLHCNEYVLKLKACPLYVSIFDKSRFDISYQHHSALAPAF